jgi:hypothetical protein
LPYNQSFAESLSSFSIGVDEAFQYVILNIFSKFLAYFVCETKMFLSVYQTSTLGNIVGGLNQCTSKALERFDFTCSIALAFYNNDVIYLTPEQWHHYQCFWLCDIPWVLASGHIELSSIDEEYALSLELENPIVGTCKLLPLNLFWERLPLHPLDVLSSKTALLWLEPSGLCSSLL